MKYICSLSPISCSFIVMIGIDLSSVNESTLTAHLRLAAGCQDNQRCDKRAGTFHKLVCILQSFGVESLTYGI